MTITLRRDVGRPLTWNELDSNFKELGDGIQQVGADIGMIQQAVIDSQAAAVEAGEARDQAVEAAAIYDDMNAAFVQMGISVDTLSAQLIDLRADIAAPAGLPLLGYLAAEAQSVLDNAFPLQNTAAVANYAGRALGIRVIAPGLAGFLWRDDSDTTTAANGMTIFIDALGRRWKRLFTGPIQASWAGVSESAADNTPALQMAIDVSRALAIPLAIGSGTFKVTSSLYMKTACVISGAGMFKTIIQGGVGMVVPVLRNTDNDGIGNCFFADMTISGGSRNLSWTGAAFEAANNSFARVRFTGATAENFYCQRLLQVTQFTECRFDTANKGVVCAQFTANKNIFLSCKFLLHTQESIGWAANEQNLFDDCEFGNVVTAGTANATIKLSGNTNLLRFSNCYAENGHPTFIDEPLGNSNTKFDSCRLTSEAGLPGWPGYTALGYLFRSNGIISLENCTWNILIRKADATTQLLFPGSEKARISYGRLTLASAGSSRVLSAAKEFPVSNTLDILNLNFAGVYHGHLMGTLRLQMQYLSTSGATWRKLSAEFRIAASRIGGATPAVTAVDQVTLTTDSSPAWTVAISRNSVTSAGGNIVIKADFTNLPALPYSASLLTWSFDSDSGVNSVAPVSTNFPLITPID